MYISFFLIYQSTSRHIPAGDLCTAQVINKRMVSAADSQAAEITVARVQGWQRTSKAFTRQGNTSQRSGAEILQTRERECSRQVEKMFPWQKRAEKIGWASLWSLKINYETLLPQTQTGTWDFILKMWKWLKEGECSSALLKITC